MNNEMLAVYAQMGPAPRGIFLLILGLIIGSFSSVLLRRLPEGQAWVSARSECPRCKHELGPLDLVPVFSYLLLGGRCRYCKTPISWHYPALELGCGLLAGATAAAGGWSWGFISLGAWVLGAAGWGMAKRRSASHDRAGFTLIEVLVSLALISGVAVTVMEAITSSRHSALAAYNRTAAIGAAREGLANARIKATAGQQGTPLNVPSFAEGKYQVTVTDVDHCQNADGTEKPGASEDPLCKAEKAAPSQIESWDVTVSVTCPDCVGTGPTTGADVKMVAIVGRNFP